MVGVELWNHPCRYNCFFIDDIWIQWPYSLVPAKAQKIQTQIFKDVYLKPSVKWLPLAGTERMHWTLCTTLFRKRCCGSQ